MKFTREEQKKAGVLVKQAPVLLDSYLKELVTPMHTLARDKALYAIAFRTTKRGDELSRTLIQRILRLPHESGLIFSFSVGEKL